MNSLFIHKVSLLKYGLSWLFTINKRHMFKSGGSIKNLKKSGDLISTAQTEIVVKTSDTNFSHSSLRGLDLVNNSDKQQQCIIERISKSTTVISIKDFNKGIVYPIRVNRNLAFYGKFKKDYTAVSQFKGNILENISFLKIKVKCQLDAEVSYKEGKIEKDQFLIYIKRFDALDFSYIHATIGDIVDLHKSVNEDEDEEYIKIIYHVITTKATYVDYGGPNKFNPIFLYHNVNSGINYYTIPLTYVVTLKKEEYINFFLDKNKKVFKNDTIDVQNQLAYSIKRVSEINTFKMFDINENCLNILPSDIIPNEAFPDSIYSRNITNFVPEIPYLLD